jgi:2-methylcitrate dehydratase PrpD
LINGTAGHAIELDDTHDQSLSHPSCVVMPAALAMAEACRVSGADFVAAIVAGYEAQCRIGAALGKMLLRKGIHPTAQLGVFGATTAAAKLLRLTRAQMTRAFGLAGSMASGMMKFTQDPEGTMVKRLHAGLPAERGILAARLASNGFTGPKEIIEGDFGYAATYADGADLARITRDLGHAFEITSISVKLYPCCRLFHALIEAIYECRADPSFSVDRIKQINTFGPTNMIEGHLETRPRSTMSAQYSLPYTAAIAVLGDASKPASYEDEMRNNDQILKMTDKVRPDVDQGLEAYYPEKLPGRVQFVLTDGSKIESTILDSKSTPANPISRSDIELKFREVTSGILPVKRQDALVDCILSIDKASDVSDLASLLSGT